MEGARPDIRCTRADHALQSILQLICRLIGKGNGDDLPGHGTRQGTKLLHAGALFFRGICRVALQKSKILLRGIHGKLLRITAATIAQQIRHAVDQHRGLAASRTCEEQQRSFCGQHRFQLGGIHSFKIFCNGCSPRRSEALFKMSHNETLSFRCFFFPRHSNTGVKAGQSAKQQKIGAPFTKIEHFFDFILDKHICSS